MTGGNTNHYTTTDLGSKDRASRWSTRGPCAAALLNARGRQYNRRSSSGPQQRRQDTAEKRNATWSTRGPPRNCFATLRRDLARQSVWWTHAVGFLSRRSAIRPAQHHRDARSSASSSKARRALHGRGRAAFSRRLRRLGNEQRPRDVRKRRCKFILGTWCSGITSASHAEGPGFKSQCVHLGSCKRNGSKLGAR